MTDQPIKHNNVVSLFGDANPSFEPDLHTISELERLLEAARSGEVVGLTGVASHRDNTTTEVYAGTYWLRQLLGSLEIIKARIIAGLKDG